MRESEKEKRIQKPRIYDDETLEKMKKYYNIDDSTELLRFIRSNGLHNEEHYDNRQKVLSNYLKIQLPRYLHNKE